MQIFCTVSEDSGTAKGGRTVTTNAKRWKPVWKLENVNEQYQYVAYKDAEYFK